MQTIFKQYLPNDSSESQADTEKVSEEIESNEFSDNHIKVKIVENLLEDTKNLKLEEIERHLESIFNVLDNVSSLNTTLIYQRLIVRVFPHLDQLVSLSQFVIIQLTSAVKVLSKLHKFLLSLLVNFSQNGYNIPEALLANEEGEGESNKGGLGLGDGEGEKDVSDQIESQDQLEDAKKPGEYNNDEEKECKEEEKGIEMEDDVGGKLQDIEKKDDQEEEKEKDDDDDKDEPDKEMGDTGKDDDILDEEIWGSDSEEELDDENKKPDETKGNKGAEETEKEMGARDDDDDEQCEENDNKDGRREQKNDEINEEADDEEHEDPNHNKRPPSPDIEPLELGDEELNLDDDLNMDKDDENGEEDQSNPFDIDEMKDQANKEDDAEEEAEPQTEERNEETIDTSDEEDEEDSTKKPQLQENEEEDGNPDTEGQEGEDKEKDSDDVEKEETEEKAMEENTVPDSTPCDTQAQSSEQQLAQDQITNTNETESNDLRPQESMALGQEESGQGAANDENFNAGGQKGNVGKQHQSQNKQRQDKRTRPGHSDLDRSLGEVTEPALKKLKAVDIPKQDDSAEESTKEGIEEDPNADLFQHIHEATSNKYDTQIIDAATKEQAEKQPVLNKDEDKTEEMKEDDDIMDIDDDETTEDNVPKQLPDSVTSKNKQDIKDGQQHKNGDKPSQDASAEVEGDFVETHGVPRGSSSSYHTRQEELDAQNYITEAEILSLRVHLEQELASWNQPPTSEEAVAAWEKLCSVTSNLAKDLSEQLRLVLEPTNASGLKGDFRTGRRINMRKVIPYIASQFRKDKIWLRRTKPSKREYQIILAIDDSSSMADNHSKELAFESLALVSRALNLLEAGELGVLSFGETIKVLHQLGEPFNEYSGAKFLQQLSFDQKKTKVGALVDYASALLLKSMKHTNADVAQLLIVVSDGRGVLSEGEASIKASVRKAKLQNIFMVFVIIDNPESKNSILDIRMPRFKDGKLLEISSYMDNFPFPFYLILRDINFLPCVLSDALRQWFELVTNSQ